MKFTKILVLLFLFVTGLSLSSQAQFFYGFTAGYNGYKLMGDTYGGINYMQAPSGGAIIGYKFLTDLNLQAELLYIDKGVHQTFTHQRTIYSFKNDTTQVITLDNKKYDNTLKLSYIEVPVFIKKSFSFKGGVFPYDRKIGKLDFDIFVGPYFAYRFGSSAKMTTLWQQDVTMSGTTTQNPEKNYDTTSFFMGQNVTISRTDTSYPEALFVTNVPTNNPSISGLSAIDAGITAGIGFSLEVSEKSKITLDARYSMGFLTIDKTYFNDVDYQYSPGGDITIAGNQFSRIETRSKIDLRNTGMGVYLGYIFFIR
jgi:hypothetical protein